MRNFLFGPIRSVKLYIKENLRTYAILIILCLMGAILGVYLVGGEYIEDMLYTSVDLELSEIILGERGSLSLVVLNLKAIIVPFLIIFILYSNRYTAMLSYLYLGYQGILLGATVMSVINETGVAGGLNVIFIILPINLLNFFVIISFIVTCAKRLSIKTAKKLSFSQSVRAISGAIIGCLIGAIAVSLVYGFVYPLLLKTAIVVSI